MYSSFFCARLILELTPSSYYVYTYTSIILIKMSTTNTSYYICTLYIYPCIYLICIIIAKPLLLTRGYTIRTEHRPYIIS